MLLRRKLCVVVASAAIFFFFFFASQNIHRRHYLPASFVTVATRQDTVAEPMELQAVLTPAPHRTLSPSSTKESEEKPEDEYEVEHQVEHQVEDQFEYQVEVKSCACESCVADLGKSKWFSRRYDPNQQPVLLEKNNNFDPDAIKWWQSLQQASSDQPLKNVLSDMFRVISPPALDLKSIPSRCRSCAVVGNSGNLRNSGQGHLIDSHNFVIRMNKALTQGYEKDVGTRTTHHFLYPESAVDVKRGVSLVLLPFKLKDLEWLTSALSTGQIKMTYMRVKDRVQADKDKVLVVNPVFFKYVHDYWTENHGRYPSTGMLAIVFALHICDQVSVFGYGADEQGRWHHYWEENRYAGAFRKTGVHNADFEINVIHRLAKEGKIKLHLRHHTTHTSAD